VFSCLTWGFAPHGDQLRSCTAVLPASHPAAPRSWTRTTDLGEITALLPSWRLRLEASNLSPVRSAPTPTTAHLGRVPGRQGKYPRPHATSARERADASWSCPSAPRPYATLTATPHAGGPGYGRQEGPPDGERHLLDDQRPRQRDRASRSSPHQLRHTLSHCWLANGGANAAAGSSRRKVGAKGVTACLIISGPRRTWLSAHELNIKGRPSISKRQLVKALRNH
jgi:hypothetical protein